MWESMEEWKGTLGESEALKAGYSFNHGDMRSHATVTYAVIRDRTLLTSCKDLEIKTMMLLSKETLEAVLRDLLQTLREEAE
jgi:hypothetical protein